MLTRKLTIEYLPLTSLRLDANNARLHGNRQVRQIAKSIEAFGFSVPILVDAGLQVVAGHGRLLAGKLLGIADVPVIRLEHLSETQRRAFMLADNRLAETSEWDKRLLAEQLMTLSQAELDFSLDVTGFEMGEINLMIENLAPTARGKIDPADAIPDSRTKPQVTQTGDLWVLGRHRVYCGDARRQVSYSALMKDRRAHMVFTDLGCNDPIDGYFTGPEKTHKPQFISASGEMSSSEFTSFLMTVFAQMVRNTHDETLHFFCVDWRYSGELISAGRLVNLEFMSLCVWVKDSAGEGPLYKNQHELVYVFKSEKKSQSNVKRRKYGRCRADVWRYPRVNFLSRSSDEVMSILRSTTKPVKLIADAILDCTARENVVLDPFLGGGSALIAAERTGRFCYAMEREPAYVDTAIRRWQHYTGLTARHEATGESFAEREKELTDGRE